MEDAALRWAALSDWRGWPGSGGPGRPERMGGRPTASALTGWTPRLPCAAIAGFVRLMAPAGRHARRAAAYKDV